MMLTLILMMLTALLEKSSACAGNQELTGLTANADCLYEKVLCFLDLLSHQAQHTPRPEGREQAQNQRDKGRDENEETKRRRDEESEEFRDKVSERESAGRHGIQKRGTKRERRGGGQRVQAALLPHNLTPKKDNNELAIHVDSPHRP